MNIVSDVHSLQVIMLCRLSRSTPEILWSVRGFLNDSPLQQMAETNPAIEIAKVTLLSWFEPKSQSCHSAEVPQNSGGAGVAKQHSKARTPVVRISKQIKRSVGSLRQKALHLGIGLGHRR
jgi:hypothetical protein